LARDAEISRAIVMLTNFAICFVGAYIAAGSRAIGRAVARTTDLKMFRLRFDTEEDRHRWGKTHSLTALLVGLGVFAYGFWRLVAH
jgi:hypothetical protein